MTTQKNRLNGFDKFVMIGGIINVLVILAIIGFWLFAPPVSDATNARLSHIFHRGSYPGVGVDTLPGNNNH